MDTSVGVEAVRRGDVHDILRGELFLTAWTEWRRWSRFGLAHGKGWVDERPVYIRAIEICEQELAHYRERQRGDS